MYDVRSVCCMHMFTAKQVSWLNSYQNLVTSRRGERKLVICHQQEHKAWSRERMQWECSTIEASKPTRSHTIDCIQQSSSCFSLALFYVQFRIQLACLLTYLLFGVSLICMNKLASPLVYCCCCCCCYHACLICSTRDMAEWRVASKKMERSNWQVWDARRETKQD